MAFDPQKTSPETEEKSARSVSGGEVSDLRRNCGDSEEANGLQKSNPLNVSPANQGIRQPRDYETGGPESSSGESTQAQSGQQRTERPKTRRWSV